MRFPQRVNEHLPSGLGFQRVGRGGVLAPALHTSFFWSSQLNFEALVGGHDLSSSVALQGAQPTAA